MTDHTHCHVLLDSLGSLLSNKNSIMYTTYFNSLNAVYREGMRAHADKDFKESFQEDSLFNTPCDKCLVEIELVMFVCLGCRSHQLC